MLFISAEESNITLEEMREELKTQTMQLASETGQASKIKITLDESTTIGKFVPL